MTVRAKAHKWVGMEGGIASFYAAVTKRDMSEYVSLAQRMAAGLPDGANVVEVAPGPGYFAIELSRLGKYSVIGLDISASFVKIANENAAKAGVAVEFRRGDVAAMPFAGDYFDFVFCRGAFKNFTDPVAALAEIRRVLKPTGRAVIIDMQANLANKDIDALVDKLGLRIASRWLAKSVLRWLRDHAYAEPDFRRFIAASGLQLSRFDHNPIGFEITLMKK